MKNIVILGSTGSIGENALNIVRNFPTEFKITGLAAGTNRQRLLEQAREFGVKNIALSSRGDEAAQPGCEWRSPEELAAMPGADLIVCAIVGMAALKPVLAAIEAGHDVAIATKEVLVAAGEIVTRRCAEKGVNLLPIDSEHSALFQALQDGGSLPWCVRNRPQNGAARGEAAEAQASEKNIARLILTASGGPFAARPDIDFEKVSAADALKHPRWKMGPKVTIDSATMMNKGLEILEARWLFDVPVEKISVLVHPESIVHSLVEFGDGAQIAQLGMPDMRLPIQYALTWPRRLSNAALPRLDLAKTAALNFREADERRFPCLRLVREASAAGGLAPTVMNAANEAAVAAFLRGEIAFAGIWRRIEKALENTPRAAAASPTLDEILDADAAARLCLQEKDSVAPASRCLAVP